MASRVHLSGERQAPKAPPRVGPLPGNDREFHALNQIVDALEHLTPEQRARALRYVLDRYRAEAP